MVFMRSHTYTSSVPAVIAKANAASANGTRQRRSTFGASSTCNASKNRMIMQARVDTEQAR